MNNTNNLRIDQLQTLISPQLIEQEQPITAEISELVQHTRQGVVNSLNGEDPRPVVIVGPCSIHDPKSAIEYATRLKSSIDQYRDQLHIIMRVYFEKPRTTVGWKGLINDPQLDNSFNITDGLRVARKLLLEINALGVPTGSEFLDTIIPQYISDLTSWAAIGARTTESQIHRELASGLSMPVGFKNGTSGNIQIAVDATYAASQTHHFLGVEKSGAAAIVSTKGNPDCHLILRGSQDGPNYDADTVTSALALLQKKSLPAHLMIDCSHGNSRKNHTKQLSVLEDVCQQMQSSDAIFGVMLESHLVAGNQPLKDKNTLTYGQSITDACIDWDDTLRAFEILSQVTRKAT